jgi:hypothetical protein
MLLLAITISVWMILAVISIVSFFITLFYPYKGDIAYLGLMFGLIQWLILNLIMWLIYFIIN